MKKEFLSIVKAIAPQVAMSLIPGGPFVKMGIKVLSETLLGKSDGTEDEIEAYLEKATPEELVKLKEAEVRIKALDVDLEKVHADDRSNAREREIALKDNTPAILAWIYTVGYFAMVGWLVVKGLPEDSEGIKDILSPLVAILSAAELCIMNYYYGSSSGSAAKNKIMAAFKR